ncbi:HYR domain-containing protein [Rasiella sp. SM2506]|uniref:HYR domain-containing protein n=1 Tax=Rasiella sp. SM2506 TaxID=3423914 RepID=UPI003D7A7D57
MKTKLFLLALIFFGTFLTSKAQVSLHYGEWYDITHSPSVDGFRNISSNVSIPTDLVFNDTGTRLYITDRGNSGVKQYNLATPYDVSTATYSSTHSFSGVSFQSGIAFDATGTRVYIVQNAVVRQYTLSSPYSLNFPTFSQSFDVGNETLAASNIDFNNSGTSMFIMGFSGGIIEYTLATPFNVNTATHTTTVSTGDLNNDLVFSPDGLKLFSRNGIRRVAQYNLTTPFDISTLTFVTSLDLSGPTTRITGIAFNADGNKIYVAGENNSFIYQFDLNLPSGYLENNSNDGSIMGSDKIQIIEDTFTNAGGTLTSPTHFTITNLPAGLSPTLNVAANGYSTSLSISGNSELHSIEANVESLKFSFTNAAFTATPATSVGNSQDASSNIRVTFIDPPALVYGDNHSIKYTPTLTSQFQITTDNGAPYDVAFNNTGLKMFVSFGSGDSNGPKRVQAYNLSKPYDSDSAVAAEFFQITAGLINPRGLEFNNDGTKMFILAFDSVKEYNLGLPFDVTTAVLGNSLNVSAQDGDPFGFTFSDNGFYMYMAGFVNKRIYQYKLDTPFDISSANFLYSVDRTSQDLFALDVELSPDGTKMFIGGSNFEQIYQYNLSTRYDIRSSTFDSSFYIGSQEQFINSFKFGKDGQNLYVVGASDSNITEYDLTIPRSFDENPANDGSVAGSTRVLLTENVRFVAGTTTLTSPTHFTINNLPSGLIPSIAVDPSRRFGTLTFSGAAVENNSSDKIGSLNFTFNDSAFANIAAANVANSIEANSLLPINFIANPFLTYANDASLDNPVAYLGRKSVSSQGDNPRDAAFSDDGLTMIVSQRTTARIDQYTLGTPFGSGGTFISSLQLPTGLGISGITFGAGGTKLYVLSETTDSVLEYHLETAYQVATATLNFSYSVNPQTATPFSVTFNPSGTKMYVTGRPTKIVEYDLSSPFDLCSAVYSASEFSVGGQTGANDAFDTAFNANGTLMYVTNFNTVFQYALTVSFDITSASYTNINYDASAQISRAKGITLSPDGTRLYITDSTGEDVNRYSITSEFGFDETAANLGAVEGVGNVILTGDTFTNPSGVLTSPTHFTITNLPAGLIPTLNINANGSEAELILSGAATSNESSDSVSELEFTYTNAAFTNSTAAIVIKNNTGSRPIAINFDDSPCNPVVITCPADVAVECDENTDPANTGTATATDGCGGTTIVISSADIISNVNGNEMTITRTWTATNDFGGSETCDQIITVVDTTPPAVICPANVTIECDESTDPVNTGMATATDTCDANPSISFSDNSVAGTGNESVITRTWTATDVNGNSATCNQIITIQDTTAPNALCVGSLTIQLDASGNATIDTATIDNGSNDSCGAVSLSLSQTDFDCSHIGNNTVTLTVTDNNNSVATCTTMVTVQDNIAPTVTCAAPFTLQLDATGNASITANDIDNGSTDNCEIASTSIDITDFTCADVGVNIVTLTVTDVNGNVATCTTEVTIEDNIPPLALCAAPFTIQLDTNGMANITVNDIDKGSTDACGIASTSIDTTDFTCADVGVNIVTLTITDVNGTTSTCTTDVTVVDNIDPIANCAAPFTIQLDANGNASITVADIDNGSTDTCGIANTSIDKTDFTCADVGPNNVTLTVTDVNGNSSSCVAIVTVQDTIDPLMNCPADFTVGTDIGICGATVSFADPIPIDTCGIASLVQTAGLPSGSVFPVGSNVIEYTATDVNGNTTSCSFTITVVDDEAPTAVCMDITIQLDAAGNATILPTDVDGGSTDNCAMDTLSIDINTFSCADIGTNNVVLTVTDTAGNTATCTAIVTVEDLTPPTVVCQDITVTLDATGVVIIDPSLLDGGSTDACGGLFTYSATPDTFTCAEIGDNSVTLTVTEAHGNSASCEAIVTVVDNTPPILVCQDITVPLGANGMVSIVASDVIASVDDACGISATGLDIDDFSCDDLGIPVTVTVFASDVNGNLVSCTAIVTVVDELGPQFDQGSLPEDQVRMADGNGEYILEDFTTNVMVTDNCSVRNAAIVLTQDPVVGTVLTVGVYDITLSVEDDFGNMASYVFELEVVAPLGVGENNFDSASLTMYPNPATDFVLLSNPQNIPLKEVSIYDVTGRLIKKVDASATTSEVRLDVSELASATYMILINTEAGQVIKQLVKE